MVDHLIGVGVRGLYVCGSTGEGMSLSCDERISLTQAFVDAVQKLSNNDQLCKKLSINSLAAAPNYSRSIQADKMIAVFKKALL